MKGISGFLVILGCIMMLLPPAIPVFNGSEKADGIGIPVERVPVITISLYQAEEYATVSPELGENLTFNGTVSVEASWPADAQSVIVTLEPSCGGWNITVPPPLVFTREITEQNFTIYVLVPPTAPAGSHEMEVGGNWKYDPGILGGSITPAVSFIIVEQYYGWSISSENMTGNVERGGSLDLVLSLENTGNGNDSFILEIDDRDDLRNKGILATVPSDENEYPGGSPVEVTVTFDVSESTRYGTYPARISVISSGAPESGARGTLQFLIEVVEKVREPGPGTGNETEPTPGEHPPEQSPQEPPVETTTGGNNTLAGSDITGQGSSVLPTILITAFVLTVIAAVISYIFIRWIGGKKRSL